MPNNFQNMDMIISMGVVLGNNQLFKDETKIERMHRILDKAFNTLDETDKANGFGWEFYAPFFRELKNKGYLKTFCHVLYASSDDDENEKWLDDNSEKLNEYLTWALDYYKKKEG